MARTSITSFALTAPTATRSLSGSASSWPARRRAEARRARALVRWRAVARILIVGGGCRGRLLASTLVGEGHAARITTREESGREAIEAAGAECWIGTPDRLATLRGSLENVTIVCWLLGSAVGSGQELSDLHASRLELFVTQAIDTTVR